MGFLFTLLFRMLFYVIDSNLSTSKSLALCIVRKSIPLVESYWNESRIIFDNDVDRRLFILVPPPYYYRWIPFNDHFLC